jgi:Flp pilus assembly CpaF family ATPase
MRKNWTRVGSCMGILKQKQQNVSTEKFHVEHHSSQIIEWNTVYRGQRKKGHKSDNPLLTLLLDGEVTEVMVNAPNQVYCERKGKLELTKINFRDNDHILKVLQAIVAPLGRRVEESFPIIDDRLPDGSHLFALIPPLVIDGPTLTIKKKK